MMRERLYTINHIDVLIYINPFQFRPIERIRCTNNLTKKQILKANDKSLRKKFERAVEKNYVKKAIKLLNKGMDPNFITEKGSMFSLSFKDFPLHATDITDLLISRYSTWYCL